MRVIILYGFEASAPEFDLRLAALPGFVQRFQNPVRTAGYIKSVWLYDTKEAAERAHKIARETRCIIEVGKVGTYETNVL